MPKSPKSKLPEEVLEFLRNMAVKGGKARVAKMTPEERKESARRAVKARWAKAKKKGRSS